MKIHRSKINVYCGTSQMKIRPNFLNIINFMLYCNTFDSK